MSHRFSTIFLDICAAASTGSLPCLSLRRCRVQASKSRKDLPASQVFCLFEITICLRDCYLCRKFDELLQVSNSREVINFIFGIVQTPLDISRHRVESGRSHRSQLSLPCLGQRSEVVERPGNELERASVFQEGVVIVIDFESSRRLEESRGFLTCITTQVAVLTTLSTDSVL